MFFCHYCGNVYSNPHSLPCGHVFCLSPCILSFKSEETYILCHDCNCPSYVGDVIPQHEVAEEVRNFKLKNHTIVKSPCADCHSDCKECELCSHCDNYLCHECVIAHKTMFSSALFGRLLDLKTKYNHLVKRRAQVESGCPRSAIQCLLNAAERAILRAEICVESMEILINQVSLDNPELVCKLTDIENLFQSTERHRVLARPIAMAMSSIAVEYSDYSLNFPLNFQNFIDKYFNSSKKFENSLNSSVSPQLSLSLPPPSSPPPLNLPPTSKPSFGVTTAGRNPPNPSKNSGLIPGTIYFQAAPKKSVAKLPEMDEIEEYFRRFGKVIEVWLSSSPPCGYVVFDASDAVENAFSVSKHVVNSCEFTIYPAQAVSPHFREKKDHKYYP